MNKLMLRSTCCITALSIVCARDVLLPATTTETHKPWFCHNLECPTYDLVNRTDAYETRKYQSGALRFFVRLDQVMQVPCTWVRTLQDGGYPLTHKGLPTIQALQLVFRSGNAVTAVSRTHTDF